MGMLFYFEIPVSRPTYLHKTRYYKESVMLSNMLLDTYHGKNA